VTVTLVDTMPPAGKRARTSPDESNAVVQYPGPKPISRHPNYYLEDGNIIFLVEKILFRVHRYFFTRESKVFRDMFSMPSGTIVEGLSDDKPIFLEGVKSVDFQRLLWLFYDPSHKHLTSDAETLLSIMTLADKWEFNSAGQAAYETFARLDSISPLKKIAVCEKYQFNRSLIFEAFRSLCNRDNPLTYEEAEEIGWKAFVIVASARDKRYGDSKIDRRHALTRTVAPIKATTSTRFVKDDGFDDYTSE